MVKYGYVVLLLASCIFYVTGCRSDESGKNGKSGAATDQPNPPSWYPPLITANPSQAIEVPSLPHLIVMRFIRTEVANVNGTIVEDPLLAVRTSCRFDIWGTEENVMTCVKAIIDEVTKTSPDDLLTSIRSGAGDNDLLMRACRHTETSVEDG